METFPEWSDDDSSDLDEFLSQPWPDENTNSLRTNAEGWPEFQPLWRQFSSNTTSKIVRIYRLPSEEQDEDRNDVNNNKSHYNDVRDDDDESVLTLSSMAEATVELATTARQTTPTKPPQQQQQQRLLRQKLPMLLCKSERIKQASPGDKRVHFAEQHVRDGGNLPLGDIIEIGVDTNTDRLRVKPPVVTKQPQVVKAPVVLKHPRIQARTATRPVALPKKAIKDMCFQDAPVEAYSGKCSPSSWIHSANLFEDKTLPSNTLDFFCRDSALVGGVPHVKEVSYSDEDTTVTSSESSGSGISSLPGGAVDEKLAQLFSLSSIQEETRAPDPPAARFGPRTPAVASSPRRTTTQKRDPPPPRVSVQVQDSAIHVSPTDGFEMHTSSSAPTTSYRSKQHYDEPSIDTTSPYYRQTHAKFTHMPPSGSKVADRQKWLNEAFQREKPNLIGRPGAVPVSKVTGAIELFGGRASRVNAVKQRKEEFERKMAEKNRGPPAIKTKWEGRPGLYKKKVVLSSYH